MTLENDNLDRERKSSTQWDPTIYSTKYLINTAGSTIFFQRLYFITHFYFFTYTVLFAFLISVFLIQNFKTY